MNKSYFLCNNTSCNSYGQEYEGNCLAHYNVIDCEDFIPNPIPKQNKIQPPYYSNNNSIDVIDFCQTLDLDFMQGNVIKYIVRYKNKNGIEDVKKAREYCDRIIKKLEENK